MKRKMVGIGVVAFVLVSVSMAGCLSGEEMTASVAKWDYELKESTTEIGYSEADEGGVFVIVELRILNDGDDDITVNALYFDLIAESISYQVSYVTYTDYVDYEAGKEVLPGGDFTFELCYEIPLDSSWHIEYDGYDDLERDDSLL